MADTTARVLQVLELLQSAQLRTVAELSQRLTVDERTVRRDVARLVAMGIPVESQRGRYGGYRLAAGQRALPVTFSGEETVAVYLALRGAQDGSPVPTVAAQTALAKMKRSVPPAQADRIEALLSRMASTPEQSEASVDPAVMLTLADAVDQRRELDLRYVNGAGHPSRRTVQPAGLVAHAGRWYLIANDPGESRERTYRVDRIRTARMTADTFPAPVRAEPPDRLLDLFADADYRWHVVLRILGTEKAIRRQLPRSVARLARVDGARSSEDDVAWFRAHIRAASLDWMPRTIMALEGDVIVESPDELKERLRTSAARLLQIAASDAHEV